MFYPIPLKFRPSYRTTKCVYYFSIPMLVPLWSKYLSTHADGTVYAFENKPREGLRGFTQIASDSLCVVVGKLEFTGDWKDSLVELPLEK